jgi:non-ribosomal peptide synthetase component F
MRNETASLNRVNYSSHKCVHDLFTERAQESPSSVAVSHGERQLTFKELNERANQLADYLRQKGIGQKRDVPVGICL